MFFLEGFERSDWWFCLFVCLFVCLFFVVATQLFFWNFHPEKLGKMNPI